MNTVSQFKSRTPADGPPLRSTVPDDDRKTLMIALIAGLAIEAVVIATVLHVPRTQPQPEAPRPPMQVAIVATKPPPPPPPPPVVKKIVKHLEPHTPPKPAPPRVAPRPVPRVAPHVDSPAVVTAPAPAPVAAAPSPAPSPGPQAQGSSAPADIAIECPVQVKPELPPKALAEGIAGRVTAHATIRGGRVVKVEIVESQPAGVFDAAVRRAMLQYQCRTNGDDAVAVEQTFDFTNAD
jgi:protein TonB